MIDAAFGIEKEQMAEPDHENGSSQPLAWRKRLAPERPGQTRKLSGQKRKKAKREKQS